MDRDGSFMLIALALRQTPASYLCIGSPSRTTAFITLRVPAILIVVFFAGGGNAIHTSTYQLPPVFDLSLHSPSKGSILRNGGCIFSGCLINVPPVDIDCNISDTPPNMWSSSAPLTTDTAFSVTLTSIAPKRVPPSGAVTCTILCGQRARPLWRSCQ